MFESQGNKIMIDLHGKSVKEVKNILEEHFSRIEETNMGEFYLITGRGAHVNANGSRGVLKKALPRLLKPYCEQIIQLNPEPGAYKIILKSQQEVSSLKKAISTLFIEEKSALGFVETLKERAKEQDVQAKLSLAGLYLSGIFEGQQYIDQGIALLEQAQALGSLEAHVQLGVVYHEGRVIKQHHEKAFGYFLFAARQDDPVAQYYLSVCYLHGKGVKYNNANDALAVDWMKKSADQGDVYSQQNVSDFYLMGEITPKNEALGIYYKTLAAKQGLAQAAVDLAKCYATGYAVEQSYQKAFDWYLSAAQFDHPYAVYQVGMYIYTGRIGSSGDPSKAFPWYVRAALLGDADGQAQVAQQLLLGVGVKADVKKAHEWVEKAIEKKNKFGYYVLGVAYAQGLGVEQDFTKAIQFMELSAKAGHEAAIDSLDALRKKAQSKSQANKSKPTNIIEKTNLPLLEPVHADSNENLCLAKTVLQSQQYLFAGSEGEQPHLEIAKRLTQVGVIFLEEFADPTSAYPYLKQALHMYQELAKAEPDVIKPQLASSMLHMARVLKTLGKLNKALGFSQKALTQFQSLYSGQDKKGVHAQLVATLNNLGTILQGLNDFSKAREYFKQALDMSRILYDRDESKENHAQLAMSLNNLGSLFQAMGELSTARPYLEEGLSIQRILHAGPDGKGAHQLLATSLNNMGGLLQYLGKPKEAYLYFEESLKMRLALYGGSTGEAIHPDIAQGWHNMGNLAIEMKDFQSAELYLEKALEMRLALYGPRDPKVKNTEESLLFVRFKQKLMPRSDVSKTIQQRGSLLDQFYPPSVQSARLSGRSDIIKNKSISPVLPPTPAVEQHARRVTKKLTTQFLAVLKACQLEQNKINLWRDILANKTHLPALSEYVDLIQMLDKKHESLYETIKTTLFGALISNVDNVSIQAPQNFSNSIIIEQTENVLSTEQNIIELPPRIQEHGSDIPQDVLHLQSFLATSTKEKRTIAADNREKETCRIS